MPHRFIVLAPFCNAGAYLAECVRSVCAQQYEDIELFLLDDASTDGAMAQLPPEETRRVHRYRRDTRRGSAANLHAILRGGGFDDEDVMAIVDGDDYLLGTDVFGIIDGFYERGALVTYGQYVTTQGRVGHCAPYSAEEFAQVRQAPWRASHLKTFKYAVARALFERDPDAAAFKDADGQFLAVDADLALMLPLLELAGFDRVAFNPTVVYAYRRHEANDDAQPSGREAQRATERFIRRQPAFARAF